MNFYTKDFLETLTPNEAYEALKEGNGRFVKNMRLDRVLTQQLKDTIKGQYPTVVSLSCMDSRTSVEHIFDQGIGEIFSIRIAGNIVNDDILGSMEYACGVVGSKLIVVVGHTSCGAVKAATENVELGHITPLLEKIQPAISATDSDADDTNKHLFIEKVGSNNVLNSISEILSKSTIIKDLYDKGKIGIVGGIFDLESGRVNFIKEMFSEASDRSA